MIKNFMEVELESFIPETTLGLDLYILRDSELVLYRKGDVPFTRSNQENLLESGFHQVYISSDDKEKFQQYLETNIGQIISNPNVSLESKSKIVYNSSTSLMEKVFADPRSGENIKRSKTLIKHTVDLILTGEKAGKQLIALTAYDYYTYTHSVNVTIFAVALAARIFGENNEWDMHELGNGFLLHDLGKSLIDPAILNKPGKLDDHEWRIMKKHPEEGLQLLETANESSEVIKQIVLEHHERFNGGGYPQGKAGKEIHPLGRICCIADVFDALTTRRTYREASSTFEALTIMREYMSSHFDPDYFQEFVLLLKE